MDKNPAETGAASAGFGNFGSRAADSSTRIDSRELFQESQRQKRVSEPPAAESVLKKPRTSEAPRLAEDSGTIHNAASPGSKGSSISGISSASTDLVSGGSNQSFSEAFSSVKHSKNYEPPPPVQQPSWPRSSEETVKHTDHPDVGITHVAGSSNAIIVNRRQEGNPILKSIRNVAWEYGEIAPDFLMGTSTCALYLSLRYHNLHPEYIHGRLKEIARTYKLRVLLVVNDVKNNHMSDDAIRLLSKVALNNNLTMILAMSNQEAGRYLETYKLYENKTDEMLQGVKATDYLTQLRNSLTTVRSVNKTDVVTLLSTFGSLSDIMKASADELRMCPGFGEQKADRLHQIFNTPFKLTSNSNKKSK